MLPPAVFEEVGKGKLVVKLAEATTLLDDGMYTTAVMAYRLLGEHDVTLAKSVCFSSDSSGEEKNSTFVCSDVVLVGARKVKGDELSTE